MKKTITILSTKKLKPHVVNQALQMGFELLQHDFIKISFTNFPGSVRENIVFTSQNAVQSFAENIPRDHFSKKYKVYCLRGETLNAVQHIPGIEIVSTAKDAASLAYEIVKDNNVREVSFICGNQRRDDLPSILRTHHINVEEIEAYETSCSGIPIKQSYHAVFFFSPSAVASFFQTNILPANIPCFCIGATTAGAVKEHTANIIVMANDTTQESMLAAAQSFFNKNKTEINGFDKRSITDNNNNTPGTNNATGK